MKIVSLLPSATEMVCALGLGESLVGVTHECDYPEYVRALPKVTSTEIPASASSAEIDTMVRERLRSKQALYSLDFDAVEALAPDLIITQALCDVCAVAEDEVREAACRLPGTPRVVNLEPMRLGEVLDGLLEVGCAAGAEDRARDAVARLRERIFAVASRTAGITRRPRVIFLEWIDPPFSAGHWDAELVDLAGGDEGVGRPGVKSRRMEWSEVTAFAPEALFIACCGFSVERTLQDLPILAGYEGFADLPAVRAGRIHVCDGNHYFSRPGPRLVDSLEMLAHALHPDVHPLAPGLPAPRRVTEEMLAAAVAGRNA